MTDFTSRDWISAYVDGELPPAETADAVRKLETDFAMQAELQSLRDVGELLRSLPERELPDGFVASVMKQCERDSLLPANNHSVTIAKSSPEQTSRKWGAWIASLVTTAAVLFLAAKLVISPETNPPARTGSSKTSPSLANADKSRTESATTVAALDGTPVDDTRKKNFAKNGLANQAGSIKDNFPPTVPAMRGTAARGGREAARFSGGFGVMKTPDPGYFARKLQDRIQFDGTVNIGDVIPYLEVSGNRTAVVELVVVDVNKSVNRLEFLLSRKAVAPVYRDFNRTGKTTAGPLHLKKRMGEKDRQLIAVYVESTQSQLAEVMRELQRTTGTVNIHLKPPRSFDEIQLTESGETIATQPVRSQNETQTLASAVTAARRVYERQIRNFDPLKTLDNKQGNKPSQPDGPKSKTITPSSKTNGEKKDGGAGKFSVTNNLRSGYGPSFQMRVTIAEKMAKNTPEASFGGATPGANEPDEKQKTAKKAEQPPGNDDNAPPVRIIFVFRTQEPVEAVKPRR